MFRPTTVPQTMGLARLQQASWESTMKTSKGMNFTSKNSSFYIPSAATISLNTTNRSTLLSHVPLTSGVHKGSPPMPSNSLIGKTQPPQSVARRMSQQEMLQRRERGLCYFCEENYTPQHKCKQKQLFLLETDGNSEMENSAEPPPPDSEASQLVSDIAISLNALAGTCSFQTLRFQGTTQK
ncbi:hypothetical protein ACHQM5_007011 [Ranunculus cassubicifolius]